MNRKAQTSIEVLMLLGGAIVVTIIVGLALKSIASNSANQAQNQIECTVLDCTGCKTTTQCVGFDVTGNRITWDNGSPAACTEIEKTVFVSCKA